MRSEQEKEKGRHPLQKGGIGPLALAGMADAAPTTTSWSAAALKQKRILKEVTRVCLFLSVQTMAPPLNAWRTQVIKLNPNYSVLGREPSSQPRLRWSCESVFFQISPTDMCFQILQLRRRRGPLQGKLRTKGMLAAAGALLVMLNLVCGDGMTWRREIS